MFETVTVDQAIKRGTRMINYPIAIIFVTTMVLCFFLAVLQISPVFFIGIAIPLCILISWVYWSFTITKWRLWAFENVRNVHELQRKAIEARLISKDGSLSQRTEYRSAADKEKWAALQSKFGIKDVYTEDVTVPTETMIYYSKKTLSYEIGFMVLLFGAGIFLLVTKLYIGAAFALAFSSGFLYVEIKKIRSKDPLIILNSRGIQTEKSGFIDWDNVSDDQVITRQSGKTTITNLEYNYPGGSEQLNIAELAIDKPSLENMLHTYRVRSEKKGVRETTI